MTSQINQNEHGLDWLAADFRAKMPRVVENEIGPAMANKCYSYFEMIRELAARYKNGQQWYEEKKNTPSGEPYFSTTMTQAQMRREIEAEEQIYLELKSIYNNAIEGQCNFDRFHHRSFRPALFTNAEDSMKGYKAFRERYFQELRSGQ